VNGGRQLTAAILITVASLAAGCGGGSSTTGGSSSSSSTTSTTASGSPVSVTFAPPSSSQANRTGAFLLKANKVPFLMQSFADAFQIPQELTVRGVNGFGTGPFYNPKDNSITFPYGFANLVFQVSKQLEPNASGREIGTAVGATDSFILAHEFTHALINMYDLPVLGREEDAADELATLILLKANNGGEYVFDAARFWYGLSRLTQKVPTLSDYADVHSLDLTRAYDMVCDLAGSSKQAYQQVARAKLLPASRLPGCPQEYEQHVQSFEQVLGSHLQGTLSLSAG
jgi:Putative metallopeptidase